MKTKVGPPAAADDPGRAGRFAVAIPCAIALTLLFFALGLLRPPQTHPEQAPVTTIALERIPPTPRTTPSPAPTPPAVRATLAPVPQRAAPRLARRPPGAHAAPRHAPQVTVPAVAAAPAGAGTGQSAGTQSGPGAGDAADAGGGTGGTGNDAVNADQPCGDVEFVPDEAPHYRGGTAAESIRATVRFADGHTESAEFPYPWIYPDAADTDPWSPRNVADPNFPARAQLPPPGTNTGRFPDLIRYILDHTRADGTTVLQDCPNPR